MTNQLNHLQAVTDALIKRGYKATMEYPGFIEVLAHGLRFDFGTANDKWDGDVEADDHSGVVHTSVPSTSTDVEAIANALAKAIEDCKPEYIAPHVIPDEVYDALTLEAKAIFDAVMRELEHAEGMYGPAGEAYDALMQAIVYEANQRTANRREWKS